MMRVLRGHASSLARTWAALVAFGALGLTTVAPALAEDGERCGSPDSPWVNLRFEAEGWPETFAERVLADLRAGMAGGSFDVCPDGSGPGSEPIVDIEITRLPGRRERVAIQVRDMVTGKRVARDVDVSRLPSDSRALAIAVAADELLRASWAELALERRAAPAQPPPPQVTEVVRRSLPAPELRPNGSVQLGARFAVERYAGGQTHLGGDVFFRPRLVGDLRGELAFGMREGLEATAPNGVVRARALVAHVGATFTALELAPLRLDANAGLRALRVVLRGDSDPGSTGYELTGYPLYAQVGVLAGVHLGRLLRLELGAGVGVPLLSLEAQADGATVTSVGGVGGHAHLGLAVEF